LSNTTRAIAHIDMDAFYASVEQRDNPELRGKPVVVGGSDPTRRGVVSAASYEARRYGIHSAMPLRTAYKHCPQACFVPVRMDAYVEESRRIMAIFRDYTPRVQPLSLDEAFLDLSGTELLFGAPAVTVGKIKERVHTEIGLNCSVGLASVKFLAKIASDLDKPDGLTIVPPDGILEFLHPLAVKRLWGVGPRTLEKLTTMGVVTIGDLASLGRSSLENSFGQWGTRLWQLANGIDDRDVPLERSVEKSVGNEHTYGEDQWEQVVLERTLMELAEKIARRLRRRNLEGRTVTLKLRTSSFRTLSRSLSGSEYLDQGLLIFNTARGLMNKIDRRGEKVRLLGISLSTLQFHGEGQGSLFSAADGVRESRLGEAMDSIGNRYGENMVRRARLLERRES
jgi:DNA polymerase IV